MKKKVLYIFQNFFEYDKLIMNSIEKYLDYEVFYLNADLYTYKYKNIFQRIYSNLFIKPKYKISLKEKKYIENMVRVVESQGPFDIIFCVKPSICPHGFMEYLKTKKIPMISHIWDSFSFDLKQINYLKYFDKVSTFDEEDAKKYNLNFNPNFFIEEYVNENKNIEYDVFTVMSYDVKRFEMLENFAKYLTELGIEYLFIVVTNESIKSDYVTIQKGKVSLKESYEYISKSKAVLEIGHTDKNRLYQGGLSFRVFEALGNKRKLITTYDTIKNYDFYNENNIAIISKESYKIDKKFFQNEYIELRDEVYEKYSNKAWIKRIFMVGDKI